MIRILSLLFITNILLFSSCSKDNDNNPVYTIELNKFNIVIDGDYHNREDAIATTRGINSALLYAKENGYNHIKFPKGQYPIISDWGYRSNPPIGEDTLGIVVPSDLTLDLREATFRLLPNTCYAYTLFLIYNVKNVTIIGGHLIGDRDEHVNIPNPDHPNSRTYEWGYGFCVVSSQNITIKDANVEKMTGDAIAITRYPYTPKEHPINENVVVTNCELHDCRRQGLTLTIGKNTVISHNKIHNIKNGTLPMCGIDIEELSIIPEFCTYTKIHNNHIYDVHAATIACNTGDYIDIYDNTLDNWIWVSRSVGVRVFRNMFTNKNGAWIYSKYPENTKSYDNIFPEKDK